MNYYNENDKFAAQWLRNLITAGLIPPGYVDERSIKDVNANDLYGYTQCHFFAGIGGWSRALELAGWPTDRPVWTGSCPCQPYSISGNKQGSNDERDLWPVLFGLIKECQPETVFGEQVASAIGHGWLDRLCDDMEGEGYAVWPCVLPSCVAGSPQKRERLWWCAYSGSEGLSGSEQLNGILIAKASQATELGNSIARSRDEVVANSDSVLRGNGVSLALARRALHGFGNAIVPQVAAEFIAAFMEATSLTEHL